MTWVVGIDIGGTFTDLVAVERQEGKRLTAKVLTTPDEPLQGVLAAIVAVSREERILEATDFVVHATTLAINTVIERKGARVALLTTLGFEDVLETGREDRYDLYNLQIEFQQPLVEREARLGITERVNARGEVLRELDADAVNTAAEDLGVSGIEAVAVCFLHSYANSTNERAAASLLRKRLPASFVSVSSDVAPIIREYERCVATTLNAYVGPRISSYIAALTESLAQHGFAGDVGIMKSDGGMCSPTEATKYPVLILESGPAAGVIAAARVARTCDEKLAVAFDMGGTTAKGCLVEDGEPVGTNELEVARLERFAKGSGFPLRLRGVDLIEVGAGGGSIASIGPLGLLQVGPESAGAEPGPACYARGGARPTVTDADLVLGYLNPNYFAGGDLALDVAAAREAIEEHIVAPTDATDVTVAAWGINDLVNENMTRAIRLHCVEHGVDPASCVLVATGGAGPVHAASVMLKLGAPKVICPVDPGVASAFGLLLAPRSAQRTVTDLTPLNNTTPDSISERFHELEEELRSALPGGSSDFETRRFVHMRLRGQAYEIRVRADEPATQDQLARAFAVEYARQFGRSPTDAQIEIVDWTIEIVQPSAFAVESRARPPARHAVMTERSVYFGETGWTTASVCGRDGLDLGRALAGPAVIEDATATVLVRPECAATIDEYGNVHISRA